MVADILTKAIPRQQFEKLRNLMGIRAAWGGVLEIYGVYKLARSDVVYMFSIT